MRIEIELPDPFLTDEDKKRLQKSLGADTPARMDEAFKRLARAALEEYKEMLLGPGIPLRVDEVRQRRLYHLIRNYYVTRIPSEGEISRVFQLTSTQARSLLRSVLARYGNDFGDTIQQMLVDPVNAARCDDNGKCSMHIRFPWVADALNEMIAGEATEHDRIRRKPGTYSVYIASTDTVNLLKHELGL